MSPTKLSLVWNYYPSGRVWLVTPYPFFYNAACWLWAAQWTLLFPHAPTQSQSSSLALGIGTLGMLLVRLHCQYINTIPALLNSWGVEGGTPLQELPGFDSFPPHVFKTLSLLSIGPTLAAIATMAGQGMGEHAQAHKFLNLCGWDLAKCGWDLAKCGWDLAKWAWDLAKCGWDLAKRAWDLANCLERLAVHIKVPTVRHSGILGAADEAVFNNLWKEKPKNSPPSKSVEYLWMRWRWGQWRRSCRKGWASTRQHLSWTRFQPCSWKMWDKEHNFEIFWQIFFLLSQSKKRMLNCNQFGVCIKYTNTSE